MNLLATGFRGAARRPLTETDIADVARDLRSDPAALAAVIRIEAAGQGFDPSGRPTMLREGHIFWDCLDPRDRALAKAAGLAWPRWGTHPYPTSADRRYADLARAMAIDEAAALKSCSWGLGQILGRNHQMAGFSDVRIMVATMMQGEREQLQAMGAFIEANGLADALRRRDWKTFAIGYNGARQAEHDYAGRLARAYDRLVAGRPASPADCLADGVLMLGEKGEPVRSLQLRLAERGYDPGRPDGWFGRITEQAVRVFQGEQRLVIDGKVGPKTAAALGLNFWPAG